MKKLQKITVRKAREEELSWVNERYQEVGFLPSEGTREVIAIAEVDGARAGLGRVVTIDLQNLELGGMYVFEEHRGKGLANEIISFLLQQCPKGAFVYCLPFAHLSELYQAFGFHSIDPDAAPDEVLKKYRWCNQTYPHKTLLFGQQVV